MLKLTRKRGERIWIGTPEGGVWLTVLRMGRRLDRVCLGFEAPASVPIAREEVKSHYDGTSESAE